MVLSPELNGRLRIIETLSLLRDTLRINLEVTPSMERYLDPVLLNCIYDVLSEVEVQMQERQITQASEHSTNRSGVSIRRSFFGGSDRNDESLQQQSVSTVCQGAYRLLEAVEDWQARQANGPLDAAISAEPAAVQDVLITMASRLRRFLAEGERKVETPMPAACDSIDENDPWEGYEDIALEDLFEWFADSLSLPQPLAVAASSSERNLRHSSSSDDALQSVPPTALLGTCFEMLEEQVSMDKEKHSGSGRISTASTTASFSMLSQGASSTRSLSPCMSKGGSCSSLPSRTPITGMKTGQFRTSLAPECRVSLSRVEMPLSGVVGQEQKPIKIIPKLGMVDIVMKNAWSGGLESHTPLQSTDQNDEWEDDFLSPRRWDDEWEQEFLRKCAQG